ncbi:MAG: ThuA domain-containing protein [Acidimicrobiia bacterium]
MAPADLLFVPQVAPYADGPAGVHGVLAQAAVGVAQVAERNGLRSIAVPDVRDLDPAVLRGARALALFTIGETPWSAEQRRLIRERWRSGALAVVGIHSASDACYGWSEYGEVLGARFDGHPWTRTMTIDVLDGKHEATAHLGPTWTWHDEVYQFRDLRPDARVLLRVPVEQLDLTAPGARPPAFGYPLAWCVADGAARTFTTALGHFPGAWESPAYLRHLEGGLRWAVDDGDDGGA